MDRTALKKLVEWEMPFGRYRGRSLADLPEGYVFWLAERGFPSGELGELLALLQELQRQGLVALLDPLRGRAKPGKFVER